MSKSESVEIEPEILNGKLLSDVRIIDKGVMVHGAMSNWGMSLRNNSNFQCLTEKVNVI